MAPARNPENSALRPSVAQKLNRRCNPVATSGPISQYDRAGSCLALSRWLRSNARNLLIPVKAMISQLHYFLPSSAPFFLGDTVDDEIPDLLVSKADNSESRFFSQKHANLQWTVWDRVTDRPASLGGRELVGCTSYRANAAASVLTQIYAHGLEAGVHPQPPEPETPKGSEVSASRDADQEISRQSS